MYEVFVCKTQENACRKFNRECIAVASTCFVHRHISVRLANVISDKLHSLSLRCALTKEQECIGVLPIGAQIFSKYFP
jgi:hypothetical protein